MSGIVRRAFGFVNRRFRRLTRRWSGSVAAGDVARAVNQLVDRPGPLLMMHSSLSHCGYIEGGAATVIEVAGGVGDTLCLPTHTYCYPLSRSEPPPKFDPLTTRSVVGEITNFFWQQEGVCRSVHPTHSLAARGPKAAELCRGHELCQTPCGPGTPYERLVESDAAVLMFGVTMNTYTLFHTAEDAAGCPYLYEPQPYDLVALDGEGHEHAVRMYRQDMSVRRRFAAMDRVLERAGLLRRGSLGHGELLFIPSARRVHEFMLARLAEDPFFLVDRDYLQNAGGRWSLSLEGQSR
jgi:aminoglycoside 3-N-acetyltransferase